MQSLLSVWPCVLLFVLSVRYCSAVVTTASVYFNDGFDLVPGVVDKEKSIAYGIYNDTVNETGWKELHVAAGYSSNGSPTDEKVMTAAGMVEGFLTQPDIYLVYENLNQSTFVGKQLDNLQKVKDFYTEQRKWARDMADSQNDSSDHWYYTGLILAQFDGLQQGYGKAAPSSEQLEVFAFDFLSGNGDYLDIANIVSPEHRPDVTKMSKKELLSLMQKGHCSGFIKVLPGYENIYAGHSSWYTYSAMNRIYKHYAFKIDAPARDTRPATEVMSFSSYPGFLSSLDDFYVIDSGLVMIQTTIGVLNSTLYDQSTSQALLAWHRVRLANWLARSGGEWANIVSQYNSGTYNNQYMVLDLKKVELQKAIHDSALWVVEQIPGYVKSGDQSVVLEAGYWPSYNIPFYEDVFDMMGYSTAVKAHGTEFSYELCPRAKIFRRDQGKVVDMESMKNVMRYNDYMNDPYSLGNPMNAICSRGDLLDTPKAIGCYDSKVTDFYLAANQTAFAVSGPTDKGLPQFNWAASGLKDSHKGQPNLFNFTFTRMEPEVP